MAAILIMALILRLLSLVGGYAIAGWIGVAVVVAFIVTQYADAYLRARSPKGRVLRQIAHELRHVTDEDLVVARVTKTQMHDPNCRHHAHPMQPTATDDEG